jgi:hypothetical protein
MANWQIRDHKGSTMERETFLGRSHGNCAQKVFGFHVKKKKISRNFVLLKSIYNEFGFFFFLPTLMFHIFLILRTSITIFYVRAERIDCIETDMSDIASSSVDLQRTLHT